LWPGFGDNIRVLEWILKRVDGERDGARATPIGVVPTFGSIDLSGLDLSRDQFNALVGVDSGAWLEEVGRNGEFLRRFGARLPRAIWQEHSNLVNDLLARHN
jgi:phosphoenolpyruvate carboxykinase (GTP)